MFINNYVAVTMYVIEYSNNILKFFEFAICRDLYFVMMTEKLKKIVCWNTSYLIKAIGRLYSI